MSQVHCWDLALQDFSSKWGYCRIAGQILALQARMCPFQDFAGLQDISDPWSRLKTLLLNYQNQLLQLFLFFLFMIDWGPDCTYMTKNLEEKTKLTGMIMISHWFLCYTISLRKNERMPWGNGYWMFFKQSTSLCLPWERALHSEGKRVLYRELM